MTAKKSPRYFGMSLRHVDGHELRRREHAGEDTSSDAVLRIDRGLKNGKLDEVPMREADLIRLLADASHALKILSEGRRS